MKERWIAKTEDEDGNVTEGHYEKIQDIDKICEFCNGFGIGCLMCNGTGLYICDGIG